MPDNNIKYSVSLPDGSRSTLNQEQYDSIKDNMFAQFPDAQVIRVAPYNPADEDLMESDRYRVSLSDGTSSTLTGEQFGQIRDNMLSQFPDAQIVRMTDENDRYWTPKRQEAKDNLDRFRAENRDFLRDYERNKRMADLLEQDGVMESDFHDYLAVNKDKSDSVMQQLEELKRAYYGNPKVKSEYKEAADQAEKLRQEYLSHIDDSADGQERRDWRRAAKMQNDIRKIYEAPMKYDPDVDAGNGYLSQYLEGTIDKLTDRDFLTRGISQISRNIDLRGIAKRLENEANAKGDLSADDIDRILTPGEKAQIQSFYRLAKAQSDRAEDIASGYNAGQSFADSLGFMAEFLISSGLGNIAGKALSASSKGLASWIGRNLMSERALNQAIAQGATKALEGGKAALFANEYLAKPIVQGLWHTGTQVSTLANISDGLLDTDANGKLVNVGHSIYKGILDSIIENWSESVGGAIERTLALPFQGLGWVGERTLGNTGFGRWARWLYNSAPAQILKEAGFNGMVGEIGEEWAGNAVRVGLGLMKPEEFKNFASWEQQLEMAASFAPLSLFGLGTSSINAVHNSRQYDRLAGKVQGILERQGASEDEINTLFNTRFDTPDDIAKKLAPYLKHISEEMEGKEATPQSRDDYKTILDFAQQVGLRTVMDEMQTLQQQDRRSELRDQIASTAGQFWQEHDSPEATGADGNPLKIQQVRVIRFADGRELFVKGTDESGKLIAVDESGKPTFLNETDVENGLADGSIISSQEMMLDDYLQQRLAGMDASAEQQRMDQEQREASNQLAQLAYIGKPDLQIGTEEQPATGTILAFQGGEYIVQSNEDGTIHNYTPEQMGAMVGINMTPKTDEQIEQEQVDEIEISDENRERINAALAGDIIDLDGFRNGIPNGSVASHVIKMDDGTYRLAYLDPSGQEQITDVSNADLAELAARADVVLSQQPAELSADVIEEPATEETEPKLPAELSPEEETNLWNEDPAKWAAWNDRNRQDGGADSIAYIQAAAKTVEGAVNKAQKQYAKELDFAKRRQLADDVARQTQRLNQLNGILADYQRRAEAAQRAELARQKAAEAEKNAPRTPVELAAAYITDLAKKGGLRGKLNREDFARELGREPGDEEMKKFFSWWAKEGQGKTVYDLAEDMAKDYDTYGIIPMADNADQKDIEVARNAIIELFNSSSLPSEITNLIAQNREAEEEDLRASEAQARSVAEDKNSALDNTMDTGETLSGGQNDTATLQDTVSDNRDSEISEETSAPDENLSQGALDFNEEIEQARQDVDTNPSEAQKEAGNYKKGHVTIDGYDISIENPKGSVRSGTDADGNPWSVTMNNDYGYIRMTEGVDGDHIDVFLSDNPTEGNVFVVDQVNPQTGEFDEHKVMYGFPDAENARAAYLANYSPGWKGLGTITEVSKDEFKKWIDSSHRKTKPFSEYKSIKPEGAQNEAIARPSVVPYHPDNLRKAYESGDAAKIAEAEKAMADYINSSTSITLLKGSERQAKNRLLTAAKGSPEYKTQDFVAKTAAKRMKELDKILPKVNGLTASKAYDAARKTYGDRWNASVEELRQAIAYYEIELTTAQQELAATGIVNDESTDDMYVLGLRGRVAMATAFLNGLNGELRAKAGELTEAQAKSMAFVSGKSEEQIREEQEQRRQQPLRDRIKEWEERTGQEIEVIGSFDEIKEQSVRMQVYGDRTVKGWFNPSTNKVVVYLPNTTDISDIDKTYLHEIISHKGLRELLGQDGFNVLMDHVYADVMTDADRQRYAEYNRHLRDGSMSEEQLRRADADEYVAHLAENMDADPSAWQKFVALFKEALMKLGLNIQLTDQDLSALLHASLARYESMQRNAREQERARMEAQQQRNEDAAAFVAGERTKAADTAAAEKNPQVPISETQEKYEDFGEKIGWAKKDLAKRGYSQKKGEGDARPAWRKKYVAVNIEEMSESDKAMARRFGLRTDFQEVPMDVTAKEPDYSKPFVGYYVKKSKAKYGRDTKHYITGEDRKPIIFTSQDQYEATIPVFEAKDQGYRVRQDGDKFKIVRPASNGKMVEYAEFDSREDAVAYLASPEGCTDLLNRKRENYELPALEELTRNNMPDYRNGRNITPDDFQKMFKFRGGEFGNWNNAAERQQALNYAYDALMDLAMVLRVTPESLSLNGELSIAFGARGEGGARAHYEPTKAVINLTKMKGAGSLAHEWAHALDNYFGLMDAKQTRNREEDVPENALFLSEGGNWKKGARQEVRDAFAAVMKAIKEKSVTRQIALDKAQKEYDDMIGYARRQLQRQYREEFARGITKYQYNRKTKQRDVVKIVPTEEQLVEYDRLSALLENDPTFKFDWDYTKSAYRASGDVAKQLYDLVKDVMPNRGGEKYGPLHNAFYYLDKALPLRERLDKAKAGETETVSIPTTILEDSRWFDRMRAGEYYAKDIEMFARAFENYVSGEMRGEGQSSDYLTYEKGPLYQEIWDHNPYPAGEERASVKMAFDHLFDVLQEKVDAQTGRTMLFRKDGFAAKEGNVYFRKGRSLVGMHNISENKLAKAMKTGGLANPSAAVVDIARQNHEDYGEISLIMPSSLVDSETGRNIGTFLGDAWTPTYPGTQKIMSDAGWDKLFADLRTLPDEVRSNIRLDYGLYLEDDRMADSLKWWFLHDTGRNPEIVKHESGLPEATRDFILSLGDRGDEVIENDREAFDRVADLFRQMSSEEEIKKAETKLEPREGASEFVKRRIEGRNAGIDKYGIAPANIFQFLNQLHGQLRREGSVNEYETFDRAARFIESENLQDEFQEWLDARDERYDAETKLFAGWTRDGEKKWLANTVENASRLMNGEPQQNAYEYGGLSATRASLVQRMRTLAGIRRHKDLLVTPEEYDERYKKLEDELFAAIQNLADRQKISDNQFSNIDYAEARLQEALPMRSPAAYLNAEYGYSIPVNGEYAESLKQLKKDLRAMPAKYFETKFGRPVMLDEFAAAVVPSDIKDETRKTLTDAGLALFEYDPKESGSRREATMKATEGDNILFRKAYHGSGASFDRFDHSHMGEGEGAQAHGWGTYVSFNEDTARGYAERSGRSMGYGDRMVIRESIRRLVEQRDEMKKSLHQSAERHANWAKSHPDASPEEIKAHDDLALKLSLGDVPFYQAIESAIRQRELLVNSMENAVTYKHADMHTPLEEMETIADAVFMINHLGKADRETFLDYYRYDMEHSPEGSNLRKVYDFVSSTTDEDWTSYRNFYTVEIPEDTGLNYMDEQADAKLTDVVEVWEALSRVAEDDVAVYLNLPEFHEFNHEHTGKSNEYLYQDLARILGSQKEASKLLERIGYAGIKYDGRMDGPCAVIFNDKDVKITDHIRFRKVTDPAKIEELENGEKVTGYRTVVLNPDGSMASPMAGELGVAKAKKSEDRRVKTSSFTENAWNEAEENPDLADENGKIKLIKTDNAKRGLVDVDEVDYNPYNHLRLSPVNLQFKDAWKRPDLIYIKSEVPKSEAVDLRGIKDPAEKDRLSPYHAEKAVLPVGIHDWSGGGELLLSRWDKPVGQVAWEEIADAWANDEKVKEGVQFDRVPPQILDMLVERGIEILPPSKGKDKNEAYKAWKAGDKEAYEAWRDTGKSPKKNAGETRFRIAPEKDKEYMDAVKAGDMEKAQQMADDAAKAAGYSTKAYHGTFVKDIDVFTDEYGKSTQAPAGSYWFASNQKSAESYQGNEGALLPVYLKMENPLVIDAGGKNYDELPARYEVYIDKDGKEIDEYFNTQEEAISFAEANGGSEEDIVEEGATTTNEYAIRAMETGHDGLIVKNVTDIGIMGPEHPDTDEYMTDDYAVFSPNQIKSANPVTYDDNGNVIPLSERFNEESNDIRFRRAFHGSPADFSEFEEGHYREGVGSFHRPGYYFASDEKSAKTYAYDRGNGAFLYEVELPDDDGSNYIHVFTSIPKSKRRELAEKIRQIFPDKDIDVEKKIVNKNILGEDLLGMFTNDELQQLGFVGIEGPMYIATMPQKQYVIFNPKDIKIKGKTNVSTGESIRFRRANENQRIFISNAEKAVEDMKMDKATPEQWKKTLEKNGGLKAAEDKWLGLSTWLDGLNRKTVTKQEVLDFIKENQIQIEEQRYSEDVDLMMAATEEVRDTIGRGKELEDLQAEIDELVASGEYQALNDDEEKYEWILDQMKERYGDDFEMGYSIDEMQKIDYAIEPWEIDEEEINGRIPVRKANSIRLDYTTGGLTNKREIALTVPTVEPWNESDKIHFGDAGEGRAIAWSRFGDAKGYTVGNDPERAYDYEKYKRAYGQDWAAAKTKLDRGVTGRTKEQAELDLIAAEQKLAKLDQDFSDVAGKGGRTLVIDEIQSKRHQEARERGGYKDESAVTVEYNNSTAGWDYYFNGKNKGYISELIAPTKKEALELARSYYHGIPAAPFEKNWHELAMKRMLRLAAEEGYDYVAWTTGEQQAERYNLSNTLDSIAVRDEKWGREVELLMRDSGTVVLKVNKNGTVTESNQDDFEGKNLGDIVGKDLAVKIMSAENGEEISGDGLRVGGEGMKAFYDDILPRFMNKYGKKWGVKVEDIYLPNVAGEASAGLPEGLTMHSVPVTPEMKESVMQGQLMFRRDGIRGPGEGSEEVAPDGGRYSPSPLSHSQSTEGKRDAATKVAAACGIEVEFKPSAEMQENGKALAGRWVNGKMYICPEHCRDAEDAIRTVLHEGVGHNGLRRLIGNENMRAFCMDVYRRLPESSRKEIADAAVRKYGANIAHATEEYLARKAETIDYSDQQERTFWDTVRDALRKVLAKIGIDVPLSERDIRWLMWQSYNANKQSDILNLAKRQVVANRLGFTLRQEEYDQDGIDTARNREAVDAEISGASRAYNFAAQNVWKRLKESFVDQYTAINELVEAIEKESGRKAASFEDIRLALNQQGSKALAKMNDWFARFNTPMWDEIKAVMKKAGCDLSAVERYVMLKHGLERNEVFAKRDARAVYQSIHDNAVKKIQESDHEQYVKDEEIAREDAKLDRHFRAIENGTDKYYQEYRERDYGGLTGLYSEFDDVEPRRKGETAEEFAAREMAARHPMYDNVADMEAAARAEVADFESKADTAELWKRINAATKETLRQQYEANIISRGQYTHVRDMFQYYVPLRGFSDKTAEDLYDYYNSDQRGVFTAPLQRAGGRTTKAESPFGFIAAAASSGIAQEMKNESKLALYYFISNRKGNELVSVSEQWYEKVGEDEEGKAIFEPVYPPFNEDLSSEQSKRSFEDWEKAMREKARSGLAFKGRGKLDLSKMVVHINPESKKDHVIAFKLGGKDMMMYINGNPRAAQAINNELNYNAENNVLTETLNQVLRTMAALNTQLNPEFWISNFQRDALFALMSFSTKEGGQYAKDFGRNLAAARKVVKMKKAFEKGTLGDSHDEQLYREFVENGGVTGYTVVYDNEYWEKRLDEYAGKDKNLVAKAIDALKGISEFGEAVEQMTRFAAFKTSREAGKDIKQSVADAKELTVNFNRKGSGKAISLEEAKKLTWSNGRALNKAEQLLVSFISNLSPYGRRFIMFFNASIQGLNAMVQLYKKNPARAAMWSGGYLAVGMMNAILHALVDDDDDYLDIPDWERRNNLLLGVHNAYLKWALPQEARVFYGLGDMIVNHAMGRTPNKNIIGELLSSLGEVAPIDFPSGIGAFAPSAATPIVDIVRNEDYKGARVYNEHKYYSEEERRNVPAYRDPLANTGGFYVSLSKVLNALSGGDEYQAGKINWNPNIIEHLVEGYTGGTGTSVEKLFQFFGDVAGGELVVRNTPFLRRVLSINDERYRNTHTTELFYYYQDEASSTRRQIKEATKAGDDKKLDKLYDSRKYEEMLVFESYKGQLKYYNDVLKLTDDPSERKDLMREQDAIRKEMIQEISNIGKND